MAESAERPASEYQTGIRLPRQSLSGPLRDFADRTWAEFRKLHHPDRIQKDLNADLLDGVHASGFVQQSGSGGTALATNDNIPADTTVDLQWPAQDGTAAAFASYPPTDNMPVRTDGNLVVPEAIDLAAASNNVTGILTVPNGGTGRSSLTDKAILIGAGAAAVGGLGFTAGDALKVVRVNAGETAYELATPAAGTVTAVTGTPPIASTGGATPAISLDDNGVSNAKLRDSAAVSVIGRSANTSGDPADIAAAANDRLLARTSDSLAFQQLTDGMVPANTVSLSKLKNGTANRLIGTSGAGVASEVSGGTGVSVSSNVLSVDITALLSALPALSGALGDSDYYVVYSAADGGWVQAPATTVKAYMSA